jgi:RNA polymerase sigma-70 factor (ECF subfamily)
MDTEQLARVRAEFEALVGDARPELLRYCARMVGSAVDAEDVVQEALTKAYRSLPTTDFTTNMRGWLFRIAHNKAIDHLRRVRHEPLEHLDEQRPLLTGSEPDKPLEERELVAIALSVFLKLTPKQRSCVILKDVLGYSLAEISELLDASIPDIKGALHRGRTRLRELSHGGIEEAAIPQDIHERVLLERYVDRFNARDFDAVRAMLADEVRLDLVHRLRRRGIPKVGQYFGNYAITDDWYLAVGMADNRPAILVYDPRDAESLERRPIYFILLSWEGEKITLIRDYRYAREVIHAADIVER